MRTEVKGITIEETNSFNKKAESLNKVNSQIRTQTDVLDKELSKVLPTLAGQEIDFRTWMPDEKGMQKILKGSFKQAEPLIDSLRMRIIGLRQQEFVSESSLKELNQLDTELIKIGGSIRWLSRTLGSLSPKAFEGAIGAEMRLQLTKAQEELDRTQEKLYGFDRAMALAQTAGSMGWQGTVGQFKLLVEHFTKGTATIKGSMEQLKLGMQTTLGVLQEKFKVFAESTKEIPTISTPGMEIFTSVIQETSQLNVGLEESVNAWFRLQQILSTTKGIGVDAWIKQQTRSLKQEIKMLDEANPKVKELTATLESWKGIGGKTNQRAAYAAEIKMIEESLQKEIASINQKKQRYHELYVYVQKIFTDLALQSAKSIAVELEPIPLQKDLSQYQSEIWEKNQLAVDQLRIKLMELQTQETLGIEIEKSRKAQLESINAIIEKSVPITAGAINEMVRLGLAANSTKVRFDALETIMTKLASLSMSKQLLGTQFELATAQMKLFEEKSKNIVGLLGKVGVTMDESSQKLVNDFAAIDDRVQRGIGSVSALRALWANLGQVINIMKGGGTISDKFFGTLLSNFANLDSNAKKTLASFTDFKSMDITSFQKMRVQLGLLIANGLEPTIAGVKKFFAETKQRITMDKEVEKVTTELPKLRERLQEIEAAHRKGAVSVSNINEKIKLYQQILESGHTLYETEYQDMIRLMQVRDKLAVKTANVVALQKDLMQVMATGQIGVKPYEQITERLGIYKKYMQELVKTFAPLRMSTEGMTASEIAFNKAIDQSSLKLQKMGDVERQAQIIQLKTPKSQTFQAKDTSARYKTFATEVEEINKKLTTLKLPTLDLSSLNAFRASYKELSTVIGTETKGILGNLGMLFQQLGKELTIEGQSKKIRDQLKTLKDELVNLIAVEIRGGVTLEGLKSKQEKYQQILALTGSLFPTQRANYEQTARAIEVLGTAVKRSTELQIEYNKVSLDFMRTGDVYKRASGSLETFKNHMTGIIEPLAKMIGLTGRYTQEETKLFTQLKNEEMQRDRLVKTYKTSVALSTRLSDAQTKGIKTFDQTPTLLKDIEKYNKYLSQIPGAPKIDITNISTAVSSIAVLEKVLGGKIEGIITKLLKLEKVGSKKLVIDVEAGKLSQELADLATDLEIIQGVQNKGITTVGLLTRKNEVYQQTLQKGGELNTRQKRDMVEITELLGRLGKGYIDINALQRELIATNQQYAATGATFEAMGSRAEIFKTKIQGAGTALRQLVGVTGLSLAEQKVFTELQTYQEKINNVTSAYERLQLMQTRLKGLSLRTLKTDEDRKKMQDDLTSLARLVQETSGLKVKFDVSDLARARKDVQSSTSSMKQLILDLITNLTSLEKRSEVELSIAKTFQKSAEQASVFREQLSQINKVHEAGAVSVDSLNKKMEIYRNMQLERIPLTTKEIADFNNINATLRSLSVQFSVLSTLQQEWTDSSFVMQAVGQEYSAIDSRFSIFTTHVDNLINSIATLRKETVKLTESEQQNLNQLTTQEAKVKSLSDLYTNLTQSISRLKALPSLQQIKPLKTIPSGTPVDLYHGGPRAFDKFVPEFIDQFKSHLGKAMYWTSEKDVATDYTGRGPGAPKPLQKTFRQEDFLDITSKKGLEFLRSLGREFDIQKPSSIVKLFQNVPNIEKLVQQMGYSGVRYPGEWDTGTAKGAEHYALYDLTKVASQSLKEMSTEVLEEMKKNLFPKLREGEQPAYPTSVSTALMEEIERRKAGGKQVIPKVEVKEEPPDLSLSIAEVENLKNIIKSIPEIDLKKMSIQEIIPILERAAQEASESIGIIEKNLIRLKEQASIKFKIDLGIANVTKEIRDLEEELTILQGVEKGGAVSLANLKREYEIYQELQAKGRVLDVNQIQRMESLGSSLDTLKTHFVSFKELTSQILLSTAVPESTGRAYDAIQARLQALKTQAEGLIQTLSELRGSGGGDKGGGGRKIGTEAEATYTEFVRKTTEETKNLTDANLQATILQKKFTAALDPTKLSENNKELNTFNNILQTLKISQLKIDLKTTDPATIGREFERVGNEIREKSKELQEKIGRETPELELQAKIGAIDPKNQQELNDITTNLRYYNEEQLKSSASTEARTQRTQLLTRAFELLRSPTEQSLVYLKGEIALKERDLKLVQDEITLKGQSLSLWAREAQTKSSLLNDTRLLGQLEKETATGASMSEDSHRRLQKQLENTNAELQQSGGRWYGATRALQGFFMQMKNLLLIQVQWYAMQRLIFGAAQAVSSTAQFYLDLQVQVSRVTSALAAQYNYSARTVEINKVIQSEMRRTGKEAQDLATILWELVSAGISHKEAMAGLPHILNLAVGAELELAEATRIGAGLYRVFGQEIDIVGGASERWRYIMDRLAATLNQSQVDMNGLVAGLGYLINEADAAGLQFEQVLGILSVLNNRLLLGSKAGRSASRVLTQLASNAKEVSKAFSIEIDFSKPLDLIDVLEKMSVALEQNSVNGQLTVEAFDKMQTIFGQVGKRAAIGLIQNLDELKKTVSDLKLPQFDDLTETMAKIKLEPLSVKLSRINKIVQTFFVNVLEPGMKLMDKFATAIISMTMALEKMGESTAFTIGAHVAGWLALAGVLKVVAVLLNRKSLALLLTSSALDLVGSAGWIVVNMLKSMYTRLVLVGGTLPIIINNFYYLIKALFTGTAVWKAMGASIVTFVRGLSWMGLAVTAIVLGVTYLYTAYRKNQNALRDLNEAVRKSSEEYQNAIDLLSSYHNQIKEITKEYQNVIPYSEEWYQVRERMGKQYPMLATYMQAEIDLTGESEDATRRLILMKETEVELDKKRIKVQEDLAKQQEATAQRVALITRNLARPDRSYLFAAGAFNSYKSGLNLLFESFTDINQVIIDTIKSSGKLDKSFELLFQILEQPNKPLEELEAYKDIFSEMGETGTFVTEKLIKGFAKLQTEIPELKDIKLTVNTPLDIKTINAATTVLDNEIEKRVAHMKKTIGGVEPEFINRWKNMQKALAANLLTPTATLINEFHNLIEDEEKNLPVDMYKILDAAGMTLIQLHDKYTNLMLTETERATEDLLTLGEQTVVAQNALLEYQKNIPAAQRAYSIKNLRTLTEGAAHLKDMTIGDARLIRDSMAYMWSSLDPAMQGALKDMLGNQSKIWEDWLNGNETMSEESFQRMATKMVESILKINDEITPAGKRQMDQFMTSMRMYLDTRLLIVSLAKQISDLGTATGNVVTGFLEQNENLIEEAFRNLPTLSRQMMSQAGLGERIEMTSLIKQATQELREEQSKFGIALPGPLMEVAKIKKFGELYEKLNLMSKKFYENEKKLMDESNSTAKERINEQAAYESHLTNVKLQELVIRADIDKQYESQREELERRKEAIKILEIPGDQLERYNLLTKAVIALNEQIHTNEMRLDKSKIALDRFISAMSQEKFGKYLSQGTLDKNFADVTEKSLVNLQQLLISSDELITNSFTKFVSDIAPKQGEFFMTFLQALHENSNLTTEQSMIAIRDLLAILDKNRGKSIADLQTELTKYFQTQQESITGKIQADKDETRRKESEMLRITMDIDQAKLNENRDYIMANFQLEQLKLQQEIDFQQRSLKARKESFAAKERIQQKELENLRGFVENWGQTMRPGQYVNTLSNIFKKEIDVYEKRRENMQDEQAAAKKTLIEWEKMRELQAKMALNTLRMGEMFPREDEIIKQYEDLKITLKEEQAKLNAEIERLNRKAIVTTKLSEKFGVAPEVSPTTQDKLAQARLEYKKTEEDMAKADAFISAKREVLAAQEQIQLEQAKLAITQAIDTTKRQLASLDDSLKQLGTTMTLEIPGKAKEALEKIRQAASGFLSSWEPIFKTQLFFGDFDPRVLKLQEEELTKNLEILSQNAVESYKEIISKGLGGKVIKEEDLNASAQTLANDLVDLSRKSTSEFGRQFEAMMKQQLGTGLGNIAATQPIIDMELSVRGFKKLGGDMSALTNWSIKLKGLEKDRLDLLMKQTQELPQMAEMYKKIVDTKYQELLATGKIYLELEKEQHALAAIEKAQPEIKIKDQRTGQITTQGGLDPKQKLRSIVLEEKLKQLWIDMQNLNASITVNAEQYNNVLELIKKNIDDINLGLRTTGSFWDKATLGMGEAFDELYKKATDVYQIFTDITTSFIEGLSTAVADTVTAIFTPPEEIEQTKIDLEQLEKDKAKISEKIRLTELGGGIDPEEASAYADLQQQFRDITEEIRKMKAELNDIQPVAKRVAEVFKTFAKAMIDQIIKIIAEMMVLQMIMILVGMISPKAATKGMNLVKGVGTPYWTKAKGGVIKSFKPVLQFEKGGIATRGFVPLQEPIDYSFLKNTMKAKFSQGGNVFNRPTLGVVGEGKTSEAVVPLPDNRSIPVSFTNQKDTGTMQDVKIINLIDPQMLASMMLQHPEAIVNIVNADIMKRGPLFHLLRQIK
jgi:hypothetical protein